MSDRTRKIEVDVAVIGGGLGGVAAALAAAEAGATVVLSDEYAWLGGQVTSQGVSALDEHEYIEHFGGTRSYNAFRAAVRRYYQEHYGAPAIMPDGAPLNPGNGWVSRLCFEPRVGLQVIEAMLAPHVAAGRLTILTRHRPVEVHRWNEYVMAVRLLPLAGGPSVVIDALYVLDATELGDLYPLAHIDYATGAESQEETDEPLARAEGAAPAEVQSFTFCFAVDFCPGEQHRQRRPASYIQNRDRQPYSFTLHDSAGRPRPFRMFALGEGGLLPFWSYRRLIDSQLLRHPAFPNDIALINWPGNDYAGASLLDMPVQARKKTLAAARALALGFLHWLQTEAPRDDGGRGYPELRLRPDLMGTADGLAQAPYIREGRRLLACQRIVEQDIRAAANPLARARQFFDTVGIGWYPLDLHAAVGNPRSLFEPTRPYQIPLGALLTLDTPNLLAAAKNIGVTHVTNGAYRLHPVEWATGEAAGTVAAFCCRTGNTPYAVQAATHLRYEFQRVLLNRGMPIAWTVDIADGHPLFAPTQLLVAAGGIHPESERARRLTIAPHAGLAPHEWDRLAAAAEKILPDWTPPALAAGLGWGDFAGAFGKALDAAN